MRAADLDCGMWPNTSGAGKQPSRESKSPVTEKKEGKGKENSQTKGKNNTKRKRTMTMTAY